MCTCFCDVTERIGACIIVVCRVARAADAERVENQNEGAHSGTHRFKCID